jgi:hypothetical protein
MEETGDTIRFFSRVLCWVRIKFLLTARRAEIIFLSFVFADELCSLLIYRHLTDWIDCHTTPQLTSFLLRRVYTL